MGCSVNERRRVEGVSLIELLVVVAIIGTVAGLAAPAIGTAMANQRTYELAADVVRIYDHARLEAVGSGRATAVRYDNAANLNQGGLTMFSGFTASCPSNPATWNALLSSPCAALSGCLDQVVPASKPDKYYITDNPVGVFDLCFEPNGSVWFRADTNSFLDANLLGTAIGPFNNGAARLTIERRQGASAVGVKRTVVVPIGGQPRIQR
ncbi:MAG: prepilin-type N-terminal cleavage/methylation domain-containing protein [Myxococcales bacterium]|nr:prepilin-type N-terminal cleavage/methylation domain-containing protein [Myxococcales bacterium]